MNRAGRYTEGHYTIKRVNTLPKQGNANWLFALRTPILDKFYRWDVNEKEWEIIEVGGSNFIPEDTNLEFNSYTNELKITFADGSVKTVVLPIHQDNKTQVLNIPSIPLPFPIPLMGLQGEDLLAAMDEVGNYISGLSPAISVDEIENLYIIVEQFTFSGGGS